VAVAALVSLLAASGAWLTHATGRVEYRPALMALTALHQVAAAIWVGGLAQLAAYWWLSRREAAADALWPDVVGRFSRLAMASVVVAVLTALTLAWTYTGSISGLVGTGYGALVLTKTVLLGAALLLAAFNLKAARRAREPRAPAALRTRLPYLVEGEAILLVMILFTAATLSAQPPSVDQAAGDHATVGEVVEVFRPKVPSLHTPSVDIMRANRAEAAALGERSRDAYLLVQLSHNVAGLILLAMSLVALVGGLLRSGGGRHWPLGFVALAAFVYLRGGQRGNLAIRDGVAVEDRRRGHPAPHRRAARAGAGRARMARAGTPGPAEPPSLRVPRIERGRCRIAPDALARRLPEQAEASSCR
jgi:putative copper resistance protein D